MNYKRITDRKYTAYVIDGSETVDEDVIDDVATREKLLKRLAEFVDRLKQDDCRGERIHRIIVENDDCDFAYKITAELI